MMSTIIAFAYWLLCIILLAPVAFVMTTTSHIFIWMLDVISIPHQLDVLLTGAPDEQDDEPN